MSAEKTESVILSITPYRETSSILRLFTRTRGLVHGIAKGVRKGGKSSTPLDRGFLLEAQLYYRPNRELHTLGSLHVTNFFPGIRSDLIKSSVRDVALELYLKSITQSEPHPQLFELMVSFLGDMDELPNLTDTVESSCLVDTGKSSNLINTEKSPNRETRFPLLWQFINQYCLLMGFGIDTENNETSGIDITVAKIINDINNNRPRHYPKGECLRITELLLSYCREHLDIRSPFNSLEFLRTI